MGSNIKRNQFILIFGILLLIVVFFSLIFIGTTIIPPREVLNILIGNEDQNSIISTIILETRLPMALAALCSGAMLSVAGLMMQTLFQNPLAGPSVLGITSGASLGVALILMSASGLIVSSVSFIQPFLSTFCAFLGAGVSILVLLIFSSRFKSNMSLLIIGLMMGYLCNSFISLLNYFSPPDEIRNYLVWGLGSFSGLRLTQAFWLVAFCLFSLILSLFFIKPLNALLAGENYAQSVGYSLKRLRCAILICSGLLVAVPTAFCGPIGFIGLIVPHLCRLLLKSSNHMVLLPASIVFGALVSLFCALLSLVPSYRFGILPINIITPIIGVPVILYLLVNRKRLPYFS